ncbi:B3 domain-containing transcription factor VRN1 [Morus notabilis]|uniref:B3 domain-containing transcription factor VRN1 n=1 Tax=Morus notabilis TaxID=981085 RepID=W9S7N1_9ROSA|nr:B3 domain-containing transcription factor VRN1 [Morus notabilis]
MASGHREDDVHTKFSPTTPHFFKIVLEDTHQNNKLQIRRRIVSKCGDILSDHVFLKLPHCGSLRWEVGLTKCDDGKVWLDKGWPEFRDYCSLVRGNLLVFRFEGNSQFSVLIFDSSTTEIEYNYQRQQHNNRDSFVKEESSGDQDHDVEFVETLERRFSLAPNVTREKSDPLQISSRSHKRRRITSPLAMIDFQDRKEGDGEKFNISPPKWRQRLTEEQKAQALRRASSFKSKHPFFMVVMQPSSLEAKYFVNLPCLFATKYLSKSAETGSREFAQDNDLKVGDVCAFVLTKSIRIVFEVSIFRKNEIGNSSLLPVHEAATISSKLESRKTLNKKARADLENVRGFRSENPFFTVAMRASYAARKGTFHIPCNFAKTYINKKKTNAILEVSDGRSWPVLYRLVRKQPNLSNRRELPSYNELGCTRNNEISFPLNSITKQEQEEIVVELKPEGKFRKVRSNENKTRGQAIQRPSSSGRAGRASEAAGCKFCFKSPQFRVDFASGQLGKNALYLPGSFAWSYFMKNSQTTTLQVAERSWPVNLLAYPSASTYMFSGGWSAFAKENSPSPGDICIFELIKWNYQVVFKVSIYRKLAK